MPVSTERVLDWALRRRLVKHPRYVTHRAYFPVHGRAYWTEIQKLKEIGGFAEIDARIEDGHRITVTLANATQVVLRPESELLDLTKPITVTVNGASVFSATCGTGEEIRISEKDGSFIAEAAPRMIRCRTAWRGHPIGTVVSAPEWKGTAETALGSWTADAIRSAASTDIAITTFSHHRGLPLEPGQTVDIMDLINWLRPCDTSIASFKMRGDALLALLEENIRDLPRGEKFLIQVSGCRYSFDRRHPQGQRVVSSDIDPSREYTIATASHNLTRTDTMYVTDRRKVPFQHLDLNVVSSAWHYIEKCGGKIESKRDGRVTDAAASP
jgi:hypothetical protein